MTSARINCVVTSSSSLEINERFEIGWYEQHVSGSSVDFFIKGRTRACFSCDGKMPDCIDRLHRWQMTGVTCGDKRFSNQVGMGSRKQDLEGELRSKVAISWSDTGSNDDNGGTCLSVRTGGGDLVCDIVSFLFCSVVAPSRNAD